MKGNDGKVCRFFTEKMRCWVENRRWETEADIAQLSTRQEVEERKSYALGIESECGGQVDNENEIGLSFKNRGFASQLDIPVVDVDEAFGYKTGVLRCAVREKDELPAKSRRHKLADLLNHGHCPKQTTHGIKLLQLQRRERQRGKHYWLLRSVSACLDISVGPAKQATISPPVCPKLRHPGHFAPAVSSRLQSNSACHDSDLMPNKVPKYRYLPPNPYPHASVSCTLEIILEMPIEIQYKVSPAFSVSRNILFLSHATQPLDSGHTCHSGNPVVSNRCRISVESMRQPRNGL
jgi:hypothetical protein